MTAAFLVSLLLTGLAALGLARAARSRLAGTAGAVVQLVLGTLVTIALGYTALYLLSLVAGFYESLTCKVVSIPSCEDPLALPRWLALPEQSVGGVMGVLPLLGVFLAKLLQREPAPPALPETLAPAERLLRQASAWLGANYGIVLILAIELWLAALRGQAEAADRQVRLALGLDAELPEAYFSVARWGAVVLALGLSAVVLYLGIAARAGRRLATDALASLGYGAALASALGTLLMGLLWGLRQLYAAVAVALGTLLLALFLGLRGLYTAVAIALGRLGLKIQSSVARLWALLASTVGRLALKGQSLLARLWVFLTLMLGRPLVALARAGSGAAARLRGGTRGDRLGTLLPLALAAGLVTALVGTMAEATTFVILVDSTGSEAGRLEATNRQVLGWADPSPERSLLQRGDRLLVIPIRSPGALDPNYPALFNAVYPSNQLERYSFFTELREVLPGEVDAAPGTDLSASLRVAARYLERTPDERVLIVFGNGEDHGRTVAAGELRGALTGSTVVHLNLGQESWDLWEGFYREAGAVRVLLFDLAASRSLGARELSEALEPTP